MKTAKLVLTFPKVTPSVDAVWAKCEAFANHAITARAFFDWLKAEDIMNRLDLFNGGWDFMVNMCVGT